MDQFPDLTRAGLQKEAIEKRDQIFSKDILDDSAEYDGKKFACYMEIDYGDLEIGRMIGRIPMFSHDPKPSREHLEEAEDLLRNIAMEAKMWISKEKMYGPTNVFRTAIICAMYGNPKEDPRSQYVVVPASTILAGYYLDDEMCGDLLFATVGETNSMMAAWSEIVVDIWKGKYENFEDIPQVAATAEAVLRLYWLLNKKYGHLIPPDADAKNLKKELQSGVHSAAAMRIEAVGHSSSGELYRRFRAGDSGVMIVAEVIAVSLKKGSLEKNIQKHMIYKLLKEVMGEEGGLTNDVLGFIKEMGGNEVYYNYVLRNVELDGMSFVDSFNHTINLITKLRQDIAVMFQQLVDEFPGDQALVEMIILCKQMLDANVYVSLIAPRYGLMKCREVPLDSELK